MSSWQIMHAVAENGDSLAVPHPSPEDYAAVKSLGLLVELTKSCIAYKPADRPSFGDVAATLRRIMDDNGGSRYFAVRILSKHSLYDAKRVVSLWINDFKTWASRNGRVSN